jgi:hypothetical protein
MLGIAGLCPHAAHRSGHEIAGHVWEHRVPGAMQLGHLTKTGPALAAITGRKPVGNRNEHPLALLAQEGFLHTSQHCADHLP